MKNGLVIADSGPVFSLAGLFDELKPLFETLLLSKRFYSIDLLNSVLIMKDEEKIGSTK